MLCHSNRRHVLFDECIVFKAIAIDHMCTGFESAHLLFYIMAHCNLSTLTLTDSLWDPLRQTTTSTIFHQNFRRGMIRAGYFSKAEFRPPS